MVKEGTVWLATPSFDFKKRSVYILPEYRDQPIYRVLILIGYRDIDHGLKRLIITVYRDIDRGYRNVDITF